MRRSASVWSHPRARCFFRPRASGELAIKIQIGQLALGVTPEEIARTAGERGFDELPVRAVHAARVRNLPLHHRDPFHRLLIAQAIHEPVRLLTVDRVLAKYSGLVEVG